MGIADIDLADCSIVADNHQISPPPGALGGTSPGAPILHIMSKPHHTADHPHLAILKSALSIPGAYITRHIIYGLSKSLAEKLHAEAMMVDGCEPDFPTRARGNWSITLNFTAPSSAA